MRIFKKYYLTKIYDEKNIKYTDKKLAKNIGCCMRQCHGINNYFGHGIILAQIPTLAKKHCKGKCNWHKP